MNTLIYVKYWSISNKWYIHIYLHLTLWMGRVTCTMEFGSDDLYIKNIFHISLKISAGVTIPTPWQNIASKTANFYFINDVKHPVYCCTSLASTRMIPEVTYSPVVLCFWFDITIVILVNNTFRHCTFRTSIVLPIIYIIAQELF